MIALSSRRERLAPLVAVGVALFVSALDVSAVSVALETVGQDLAADVATTTWFVTATSLAGAATIVTAGRLADRIGPSRFFLAGCAVYIASALLAIVAQSAGVLIAARAGAGLGGAMVFPAAVAVAYGGVSDVRRAHVGGLCMGAIAVGSTIGPLFGGLVAGGIGWRLIFAVELPLMIFAGGLLLWSRPPAVARHPDDSRIDLGGSIALGVALTGMLLLLDSLARDRTPSPLLVLGLLAAVVAFVVIERRAGPAAIVPPQLRRLPPFRVHCVGMLLVAPAFFGALVYLPMLYQNVLGYSALHAGAALMPMMLSFVAGSVLAGPLHPSLGNEGSILAGGGAMAAGSLVLALTSSGVSYGETVVGMILIGAGTGFFFPGVMTLITAEVPVHRRGVAMGGLYACQVAGSALGLGLFAMLVSRAADGSQGFAKGFQHGMTADTVLATLGVGVTAAYALVTAMSARSRPRRVDPPADA